MTDEEMKTPQYGHYQVEMPSQSPLSRLRKKKKPKKTVSKKIGYNDRAGSCVWTGGRRSISFGECCISEDGKKKKPIQT